MFANHSDRRESSQALIMDRNPAPTQHRVESEYLEPKHSVRNKYDEWNPPPGGPPVQSPDSGVVMDSIGFDDSSVSWKKPPYRHPHISDPRYRPESVSVEGHEYEQLPGVRRQHTVYADIPEDPHINGTHQQKLPTPPNSRATSMTDIAQKNSISKPEEQRRRENPLYDSMPEYKSMASIKSDYPPPKSSRCMCVAVVMSIILAIAALALAIVVIILLKNQTVSGQGPSVGASTGGDPAVDELKNKIEVLEKKLLDLQKAGTGAIVDKVESNSMQLKTVLSNLTRQQSSIEDLKKNVDENGVDVDKMNNTITDMKTAVYELGLDIERTNLTLSNKTADMDYMQKTLDVHTSQIESSNKKQVALTETVDNLIQNNTIVQLQMLSSNNQFSNRILSLNNSLSSMHFSLLDTKDSIAGVNSSIGGQLLTLNASIYDELAVISKMPGPQGLPGLQGPAGAGDMSRCQMLKKEAGTQATASEHSTAWYHGDTEAWKILGVECTTDGGTYSLMEKSVTDGKDTFRCKCGGRSGSASSRYCQLYVWICPLNS